MRRVANRQPFIRLFARVVRSNAVLSKETMDAESSEVLGMREGEFGEREFGEGEFGEGRRDSECSESGESSAVTPESSLYIPTPDRPTAVVRPIDLPARLCFIELSHLGSFVSTVNQIRTCTTSGCKGNLAPVAVKCRGLGGAVTVRYSCDGCGLKGATFEAHSKCETVLAGSNTISVSLQVAFIIAGCTHATYCKALSHSLGIDAVSAPTFMCAIRAMHSIVESMLDEVCEVAKQEYHK